MDGSISEGVSISIEESIAQYLATLRRRGRSISTVGSYGWGLRGFSQFLTERGIAELSQLRRVHLEAWQDRLLDRDLAPKSRQLAATAVRELLKWAIDRDLVQWRLLRAVEHVKTVPGLPRPIPLPHLERIQAHIGPRRPGMTEAELRDRALFTVLLVTGARISEVFRMRRHHFIDDEPLIVLQKGGTEKELLITPTARQRVLEYLAVRKDSLPDVWVTTGRNRPHPLGRSIVSRIWWRLANDIGVPRWTSHQLRHTCATELKRAGIDDLVIAHHLGHSNLATLPNYAQLVDVHRQAKLEVLEGLLNRRLDMPPPDGARFRQPARVLGRPDNRRREGK